MFGRICIELVPNSEKDKCIVVPKQLNEMRTKDLVMHLTRHLISDHIICIVAHGTRSCGFGPNYNCCIDGWLNDE